MINTKRNNRKINRNIRKTKKNTRKTKKNNVKGGGIKSKLKRFFGIDKKKDYLNDRNNLNREFDIMKKPIKVQFYKQIKNKINQYKLKDKNHFRWVTDSNGNNILEILLADNNYHPETIMEYGYIKYLNYNPKNFDLNPGGDDYETEPSPNTSVLRDSKGNIIAMRINNEGPMYPYKIKSLDGSAIFKLTLDNQEKMQITIYKNQQVIELPRLQDGKPVYVLSKIIKKSRLSYLNKAYNVFKMHKNNDNIYFIDNILDFDIDCNKDVSEQTECSYSLKNNKYIFKPQYDVIFQGYAHLFNPYTINTQSNYNITTI